MSASQGKRPSLDGVWAKIDRANTHIGALRLEVEEWVERQPKRAIREPDPDGLEYRFRINFNDPPLLVEWGVGIGDIAHNLRSALDHLVWQLVLVNDRKPHRRCGFPIYAAEKLWSKKSAGPSKIIDTPPAAQSLIKSLQPCFRSDTPDNDPLWILHDLNNTDKHRVVVPAVYVPHKIQIQLPKGGASVIHADGNLESGAVFLTVYPNQPTPEYDPKMNAALQVSLDLPGFPELGSKLTEIREEVIRLVAQFTQFFNVSSPNP